ALDVAIVEEPLLEEGPWRLGGRTRHAPGRGSGRAGRGHGHIARGRDLELAVGSRGERDPFRVRVGSGTETASEKGPESEISVGEAERIRGEAEEVRRGLIVERIP